MLKKIIRKPPITIYCLWLPPTEIQIEDGLRSLDRPIYIRKTRGNRILHHRHQLAWNVMLQFQWLSFTAKDLNGFNTAIQQFVWYSENKELKSISYKKRLSNKIPYIVVLIGSTSLLYDFFPSQTLAGGYSGMPNFQPKSIKKTRCWLSI